MKTSFVTKFGKSELLKRGGQIKKFKKLHPEVGNASLETVSR